MPSAGGKNRWQDTVGTDVAVSKINRLRALTPPRPCLVTPARVLLPLYHVLSASDLHTLSLHDALPFCARLSSTTRTLLSARTGLSDCKACVRTPALPSFMRASRTVSRTRTSFFTYGPRPSRAFNRTPGLESYRNA